MRVRLAVVAGVLLAGTGLAMVAGVPIRPFSLQDAFVTIVGALALVQGVRYLVARRGTDQYATATGDPEERYHVPVPGDDFDAEVAKPHGWGAGGAATRGTLRKRVREAVVGALVTRANLAQSDAENRVEAGTWTDDPVAAAFLAEDPPPLGVTRRLVLLIRGRSPFDLGLARTISELEALYEESR